VAIKATIAFLGY